MITGKIINDILNLHINTKIFFSIMGLSNSSQENTLTFCDDEKYIDQINNNINIRGIFAPQKFKDRFRDNLFLIYVEEPRLSFYKLYNQYFQNIYKKQDTEILKSAKIHQTASIAEYNVVIDEHVTIGPNVTIYPDVIIGKNCIIKANSVIGVDDVETKRTSEGLINVFHDGKVIINDNVSIGANTTIVKGIYGQDTIIETNTLVSNNCHIGHRVQSGENCLILTCFICGGTVIEKNVRISPGAVVSNQIRIGESSNISIGAVVIKDVPSDTTVSGNFALEHNRFLYKHVKTYGPL